MKTEGGILVTTKNEYPWEYLTSISLSSLICEMTLSQNYYEIKNGNILKVA